METVHAREAGAVKRPGIEELRAQLRDLVDGMDRERAAGLLRVLSPERRSHNPDGPWWLSETVRRRRKERDQEIAERARQGDPTAQAQVEKRRKRQATYRARRKQADA